MNADLTQHSGLALTQRQSGSARGGVYPSHNYGQDTKPRSQVNQ
jgi:hypothetical protein